MKLVFCVFVFFSSLFVPGYSAQEQQLGEGQILNIMMTIDKGEIAAAKEATKKKVTPAVDLYAKHLIEQHQRNLEELIQFAKQEKIEPKESEISNSMVASGKTDLKALSALQGKAFDKAFIDAMVTGHQEGLKLIDTKLFPEAKSPQLQMSLEQFRKMVAAHLEKGLTIQKTL